MSGRWSNEQSDPVGDAIKAMKEIVGRPLDHERRYVAYLDPVDFGTPTPEGRIVGDCLLCAGDAAACDCQLRYTSEPGISVRFEVRSADDAD